MPKTWSNRPSSPHRHTVTNFGSPRRSEARGWSDQGSVAVMAFQVPLTRRDSINGLLLAVPIDQVAQLPGVGNANTARPRYSKSGRFSTTTWTDKASGNVFICLVARGQH